MDYLSRGDNWAGDGGGFSAISTGERKRLVEKEKPPVPTKMPCT